MFNTFVIPRDNSRIFNFTTKIRKSQCDKYKYVTPLNLSKLSDKCSIQLLEILLIYR